MSFDADAQDYIDRVIAVDGFMWPHVQTAINRFVVGCKADPSPFAGVSNWDAMKACCLLAGAQTYLGALVPLKGPSPTNVGFAKTDYHPALGLKGDGTTKRIDSGWDNADDPLDNQSVAVYQTEQSTASGQMIGRGSSQSGTTAIRWGGGGYRIRSRSVGFIDRDAIDVGLVGLSRSSSTQFTTYISSNSSTHNVASDPPYAGKIHVFSSNAPGALSCVGARLSFYGIGEAVDLGLLDKRLTKFMQGIQMPTRRGFPLSRLVN